MKYERFEDLPVWQSAAELAAGMYRWSAQSWFRGKGDLSNQLQRAALSISNNIAEGFERGSTKELLQFLYIARGSVGEVRSMLGVIDLMEDAAELKNQVLDYKSKCESISRQIRGWTNSLQNSDIEGQRFLNDKSKQSYERQKRRAAAQQSIDAANEELHRKREAERMAQMNNPTDEVPDKESEI